MEVVQEIRIPVVDHGLADFPVLLDIIDTDELLSALASELCSDTDVVKNGLLMLHTGVLLSHRRLHLHLLMKLVPSNMWLTNLRHLTHLRIAHRRWELLHLMSVIHGHVLVHRLATRYGRWVSRGKRSSSFRAMAVRKLG